MRKKKKRTWENWAHISWQCTFKTEGGGVSFCMHLSSPISEQFPWHSHEDNEILHEQVSLYGKWEKWWENGKMEKWPSKFLILRASPPPTGWSHAWLNSKYGDRFLQHLVSLCNTHLKWTWFADCTRKRHVFSSWFGEEIITLAFIFVCRLTLHWLAKLLVNLSMFQRLELSHKQT